MKRPKRGEQVRCLKFTGYIFLPKGETYTELRHQASRMGMGRISIFNDTNTGKTTEKMIAFDNIGDMVSVICNEFKKRAVKLITKPSLIKKVSIR